MGQRTLVFHQLPSGKGKLRVQVYMDARTGTHSPSGLVKSTTGTSGCTRWQPVQRHPYPRYYTRTRPVLRPIHGHGICFAKELSHIL